MQNQVLQFVVSFAYIIVLALLFYKILKSKKKPHIDGKIIAFGVIFVLILAFPPLFLPYAIFLLWYDFSLPKAKYYKKHFPELDKEIITVSPTETVAFAGDLPSFVGGLAALNIECKTTNIIAAYVSIWEEQGYIKTQEVQGELSVHFIQEPENDVISLSLYQVLVMAAGKTKMFTKSTFQPPEHFAHFLKKWRELFDEQGKKALLAQHDLQQVPQPALFNKKKEMIVLTAKGKEASLQALGYQKAWAEKKVQTNIYTCVCGNVHTTDALYKTLQLVEEFR